MKDNFTLIATILDRSGSMAKLSKETIAGFNSFIQNQKEADGEVACTLATFASDYSLVYDFVPLKDVKELTPDTYKCSGFTCLYKAICETVDSVGVKLNSLPENEKPSKVLVNIITDGEENYSNAPIVRFGWRHNHIIEQKVYSLDMVKQKIEHQSTKYNWLFTFVGAGIDAFSSSESLGMNARNSLSVSATSAGVGATYAALSTNAIAYRSSNLSAQDISEIGFFNLDQKTTDVKKDS